MADDDRLLAAVRVLDVSRGDADAVTRLFADLGADVLKVEPPSGSPARGAAPTLAGVSLPFALHNANKRGALLNPFDEDDRRRFLDLAATADIVVDSGLPGQAAAYGPPCAELADRYPQLVALSVTDFGTAGPRSAWCATDPVLYAMSGSLSRSGPTTGTPVLPPDGIASATAAAQAAWAALVAYYNRLRCGTGDYIDFARFDAVVMALDPAFGAHGQAAAGVRHPRRWRGRPKNQDAYPIYTCRDGYVRICVMAPRQWRGLRAWLGEPEEFQDPEYDVIATRFAAWPRISTLIRALFAGQTMAALVAAGQAHGVPIAAVLSPSRILASDHFQAVGAVTDAELAPGVHAHVPTGYFVVDGRHAGFRAPAPALRQDEPRWLADPAPVPSPSGTGGSYPFTGLRIVDLGIIVAGGELSRLFGDLGADVIKVESAAYPDGLRQVRVGEAMSESFAWTHRNNLGLGLDLRSARGTEIFGQLVGDADAVFANFKPGTLAALGLSYDTLHEINPAIVLAESSAFGDQGPWSTRMGYGPLVRAATGVTRLWTSDEAGADTSRHPFYDATTVFPDHVVARITAIAALAALIRRHRTGAGARVHVSQAEAVVNQLDTLYVTRAAGNEIREDTSVHAVYPCAGDDEWCVISIASDADWRAATAVFGLSELASDTRFSSGESRVANRRALVALVSKWTRTRAPVRVAEAMQAAGVPAGQMNRPPDILHDPGLRQRKLLADMVHPRPSAAGGDRSVTVSPHTAGTAASGTTARPAHPRDLPQDTWDEHRGDRALDRRRRVVRAPGKMSPMPVDPRTPVLVGYGQINQRDETTPAEPVDLMAAAARHGADARVLAAVDSVRVVNLFSAHYRDPGLLLGERIGADNPATRYSGIGGNMPQSLVNQACLDIQHGRADVVLIAGAETWHTRTRLRAQGGKLAWTRQDDSVPMAEVADDEVPLAGDAELRIGLDRPAYVYPMFEQALRIANGESTADHRRRIGELWARFNAVAVANPHAWIREPMSAEQIWRPGPANRMISWPYTKLMNSNNMVDQAAALILTSAETATRLRIPAERWVYPCAGTDAHDVYAIAERAELHRSPAIRIAGARALELAGLGIDDIDYVDLYSCFPSAVQIAAGELGLGLDDPARPLTVTGGLTFAGGPWNNYVTHSIATMAELLAANPGRRGLVTANGGYLTKHSFGVYGTEPPSEFRWENVQSAIDRQPTRPAIVDWEGVGAIEAWTTPFSRDGQPEKAFLAIRTPEEARTLALIADPESAETTVGADVAGAKAAVRADGTARLL